MIPHYRLRETESTNLFAKQLLSTENSPLFAVSADSQTKGRGRHGNCWISAPLENVYLSIVHKNNSLQMHELYPIICALSLSHVLKTYTLQPQIKWPNDLMVSGKKIAGILIESVFFKQDRYAILGMGLNCNLSENSKKQISQRATSLNEELSQEIDVQTVLHTIIATVTEMIDTASKDPLPLIDAYKKSLHYLIGLSIAYKTGPSDKGEGIVQEILDNGSLVVQERSGLTKIITSL